MMLAAHLAFNASPLVFAPLCHSLLQRIERKPDEDEWPDHQRLSNSLDQDPSIVRPLLKRRVHSMIELLSSMAENCTAKIPDATLVNSLEKQLNQSLTEIRAAYAGLPKMDPQLAEDVQNLLEFAIRIERCGDIFAGSYLRLRTEEIAGEYQLSDDGQAEVAALAEQLAEALLLAQELVWAGQVETARRLVEHKQNVSQQETESRQNHLQRVRKGNLTSLSSSDQHLELIGALKEVNSKLASIGYAILRKHGALKKTRLKSVPSEKLKA